MVEENHNADTSSDDRKRDQSADSSSDDHNAPSTKHNRNKNAQPEDNSWNKNAQSNDPDRDQNTPTKQSQTGNTQSNEQSQTGNTQSNEQSRTGNATDSTRNENTQSPEHRRNADAETNTRDEETPTNESPLERDISTDRTQAFDGDPPTDPSDLHDLESDLASVSFPTTGRQVVDAVGTHRVITKDGSYTVSDLIPETDTETFDSPGAVRTTVQRPTVAGAMKQIVDASSTLPSQAFPYSQRRSYEKTFNELRSIDSNDDDEDVTALTNWVLEQIRNDNALPSSRAVRQQAADITRTNGYRIRNDEWLGV